MIPEELVLTLRCGIIWHARYWCSWSLSLLFAAAQKICLWLERQSWLKTPRKNLAGSIKSIQITPPRAAGYKNPVIQAYIPSIYGRAWDLSWTYTRTMTTSSKPPGHICLWHCLQFIKRLIQCQTSSFLTFVTSVYQILASKGMAKLDALLSLRSALKIVGRLLQRDTVNRSQTLICMPFTVIFAAIIFNFFWCMDH